MPRPATLELLAPARDAAIGIEAISHGADAVYIGGPAFGARASADNGMGDIERLAAHAHRYHARVFVALNTILRDDELEPARRIAWQAWEAGADALIVQDMGLLELDLPPIQLHASTQCDIRNADKARFLEQVGFSQLVLARELSLEQIRDIAAHTSATLEFFIHGALCVSYSGQCYISHAHSGRSANRGECSQACRLPWSLADQDGQILARDRHLLSLKDNDQGANLRALIDAGIRSFKIEGRLKDLGYVKNITAHYRRLLDAIIDGAPDLKRASSGRCTVFFEPRPQKSFNRGATDYFVQDRQADIAAFDSATFVGEAVGRVTRVGPGWFEIDGAEPIHNGDGLCHFDDHRELAGMRVNRAEGRRLFPADPARDLAGLRVGTEIHRNHDQEFARALERKSAERRIGAALRLEETPAGFALHMTDEDGIGALAQLDHPREAARNAEAAQATLRERLGRLGNTIFSATAVELDLPAPRFIPVSALNALRRRACEALEAARLAAWRRPARAPAAEPPAPYPETELTYLGNVFNHQARAFYARHGVALMDAAFEANEERGAVSLMITKHCLRYSFNLCPKQAKGVRPDPMTLTHGSDRLTLRFDCKRCEMHVVGRLKVARRKPSGMVA